MCNQMVTSEIREQLHGHYRWLPTNIMGDELRSQSWIWEKSTLSKVESLNLAEV